VQQYTNTVDDNRTGLDAQIDMREEVMAENNGPQTTAQWFEKGRQYFHQPDGVKAVEAMQRVIDMDPAYRHPDGDNPYFYLGKIHEVEGHLDQAIMCYTRALAVNPVDEESLIGRGSCYTVVKRHQEAIADFRRLLEFPAKVRRVPQEHLLYVIAENYRQLEDWGQAFHWATQAANVAPHNQRHQDLLKRLKAKMAP
jgi:tetratricopeptide (TPR) repeat protein